MRIVVQILMIASAVSLVLAILMGFNLIAEDILNVSGRGFLELSVACAIYAACMQYLKPFGGDGEG